MYNIILLREAEAGSPAKAANARANRSQLSKTGIPRSACSVFRSRLRGFGDCFGAVSKSGPFRLLLTRSSEKQLRA